jgi:predicted permease
MLSVVEIVFPVFIIIVLGYILRRTGLVNKSFFDQANGLVFYICLPLLLFYKIGTADFSSNFNLSLVFATSCGVASCFLLSYLTGFFLKFSPPVHGVFCQGSFRGNLAYIGLAIIYNAYGDSGLTRAGVLLGFLVPVLNLFAILALTFPGRKSQDKVKIFKEIILNPLILSSLAGIAWSYFQLPLPAIVDRSLSIITGMTLPLALLAIGDCFSIKKMKGDIIKSGMATACKLILLPLVTALYMLLFQVSGMDFAIGLLMAGAPTAVATFVMASKMGGDEELAGTIVVMATGFSAVSYSIILFLLKLQGF